jgi:hypothetical protein
LHEVHDGQANFDAHGKGVGGLKGGCWWLKKLVVFQSKFRKKLSTADQQRSITFLRKLLESKSQAEFL